MALPSEDFRPRTPFDLHVLGTPPAFILSQDQTLILSVLSVPDKLGYLFWFPVYSVLLLHRLLFFKGCESLHTFFETFLEFQGYSII